MPLKAWVRLPTAWIRDHGLKAFRWAGPARSDNTAALMLLVAIAHRVDDQSGLTRLTYDQLAVATGLRGCESIERCWKGTK